PMLVKIAPNGLIDGCEQFSSCIAVHDYTLPTQSITWTRSSAPPLPDLDVVLEPQHGIQTIEFCGTPLPPKPTFHLPDTICQQACVTADSLRNDLAHHVEWHIAGHQLDSVTTNNVLTFCFTEPGDYEITQTIWLLGCNESYTRIIHVLADDLVAFLPNEELACGEYLSLSPSPGDRPLRTFQWNTGESSASIVVAEAGWYQVTVSDGYCTTTATTAIRFFSDENEIPVFTPSALDTTVCLQSLPLSYRPHSPYTNHFWSLDANKMDSVVLLPLGQHFVHTNVEGCLFSQQVTVKAEDCSSNIYFPNAFSPNNDGINDFFGPQGINYEPIRLTIFNRWGQLLYQTTTAPFRWAGSIGNTNAEGGVFVYQFEYKHVLTGMIDQTSGDVTLIR
ncbi:MAG: gliding motility-associated C-terminal domain-containing protein, partial [Bacteroidota bacterium]